MTTKDFIKATEFPCGKKNVGKEPFKSNLVAKLLAATQLKQTGISRN